MNESHLHLKVCEGCGRLWLRNIGTYGIYCRRCNTQLAQFPPPRGRRRTGRPHKGSHACEQQLLARTGGKQ